MSTVIIPAVTESVTYRRVKGDILWHLSADCERWPIETYDEITSKNPPLGAFCPLCIHQRIEELRHKLQLALTINVRAK